MADWSAIKTSRSGLAGFNKGTYSKVCSFKVHLFNRIYKGDSVVKPRVVFVMIYENLNHYNRFQIFVNYSTHVTSGYTGVCTI